MAQEIERKFLVAGDAWRGQVVRSTRYRQAYLGPCETASVRVRIAGDAATLNIKSADLGVRRLEFEYEIPLTDARELLGLATGHVVEKTRHIVACGDHRWEVDEFAGDNEGLIVAEIELSHEDEDFGRPPWLGREVSDEARYYNVALAERPFAEWSPRERAGSR